MSIYEQPLDKENRRRRFAVLAVGIIAYYGIRAPAESNNYVNWRKDPEIPGEPRF